MLKRCVWALSLVAGTCLLAGCPGPSGECGASFPAGCADGEAVNCSTTHCGFGPCQHEVTRNSCSESCKMVDSEKVEANYNTPFYTDSVATDQAAVCTEWKGTSSDAGTTDAGSADGGSSDAGMSDVGQDDATSSDSGTSDATMSDAGDAQGDQ